MHRRFYERQHEELRKVLRTMMLVEEEAVGACVPYFMHWMTNLDLDEYIWHLKRGIEEDVLSPEHHAAACRFFIRVIRDRRNAQIFLQIGIFDLLIQRMKSQYMKEQDYSYIMTKKVLVWLSIHDLQLMVKRLYINLLMWEFNPGIVDLVSEVTSLCAPVTIPRMLPLLSLVRLWIPEAHDPRDKQTMCYAIRRLSGSARLYMMSNGSQKVQLMEEMYNIKTNIKRWLHNVNAELQDSINQALAPFTAPKSSEDQPTEPQDVEFQPLPHTKLLDYYRQQPLDYMKEAEDTEKQRSEISAFVTSLVSGRKITKDFLKFMLSASVDGPPMASMTAILFFSEALKHPKLIKQKYQKRAIKHLLMIIPEGDESLCSVAMEGLGNAVIGVPELVEHYWEKIMAHLEFKLSKTTNTKVIVAALRAMSSFITHLKLSVLSSQFIELFREHLDYPDEEVQIAAINLLRDLTESCRRPLFGYFTDKVKSMIPTLLPKFHSDNQEIKAAVNSSLQSCLAYIKGANIRGFFRTQKSPNFSDLRSIYSCLAQNHPKMMKTLLLQTPAYLFKSEDKEAVVRHVEFLKDAINRDSLKDMELYRLTRALASLHREDFPLNIRKAAKAVVSILATKWYGMDWARDKLLEWGKTH